MTRPTPNPGTVLHVLKRDDNDTSELLMLNESALATVNQLLSGVSHRDLALTEKQALAYAGLHDLATQYAEKKEVPVSQVAVSVAAVEEFIEQNLQTGGEAH